MTTLNPACLLRPADVVRLEQEQSAKLNRKELVGQPTSEGTYIIQDVDSWQTCYDITVTPEAAQAYIEGTLTFGDSGVPNQQCWLNHCTAVYTGYWYEGLDG
jgi:hypothetical protein